MRVATRAYHRDGPAPLAQRDRLVRLLVTHYLRSGLLDFREGPKSPKLIDLAYRHAVVELERQPCVAQA